MRLTKGKDQMKTHAILSKLALNVVLGVSIATGLQCKADGESAPPQKQKVNARYLALAGQTRGCRPAGADQLFVYEDVGGHTRQDSGWGAECR